MKQLTVKDIEKGKAYELMNFGNVVVQEINEDDNTVKISMVDSGGRVWHTELTASHEGFVEGLYGEVDENDPSSPRYRRPQFDPATGKQLDNPEPAPEPEQE